MNEPPPLDRAMAEMWLAERARPGIAPERAASILAGVESRLALPVGGALVARAMLTGAARRLLVTAFVAGAFVGAGAGAGITAWLRRPAPARIVRIERVIEAPPHDSTVVAAAGDAAVAVVPAVAPAHPASAMTAAPVAPRPRDDADAARERAGLEIARTAVGRGDGAAALEALARSRREFPTTRFAEERAGLEVYALLAAGRTDDARARAVAFRRRYAQSLQWPAMEGALRAQGLAVEPTHDR